MSTLATVLAYARAQAQTDSNGLTDTNGIIFANEALFDFRRELVNHGIDAASIQEAYCDGLIPTTSGNGSTFLYPTDMFLLKAIEVNFADTQASNYLRASQIDQSNVPGQASFSWLRQNQSTQSPLFADNGDFYEIFPAFSASTNISQAIRILYFQKPTEFVSTSDTISYPESQDYRILGWRIAANYYYSVNKFEEGDKFYAKYADHVKQFVETLGRGSQQPIDASPIQDSGWSY